MGCANCFYVGRDQLRLCRHGASRMHYGTSRAAFESTGVVAASRTLQLSFLETLKFLTGLQRGGILGEPLPEIFPQKAKLGSAPGGPMSSNERRIAPRKDFAIPVKFHARASETASATVRAMPSARVGYAANLAMAAAAPAKPTRVLDMQEGVTVNLSERGIYFKSAHKVTLGQSVELYFTLPRELTGRNPEAVRCSARVVHVEPHADERGLIGAGAEVERFEPLQRFRTWD